MCVCVWRGGVGGCVCVLSRYVILILHSLLLALDSLCVCVCVWGGGVRWVAVCVLSRYVILILHSLLLALAGLSVCVCVGGEVRWLCVCCQGVLS